MSSILKRLWILLRTKMQVGEFLFNTPQFQTVKFTQLLRVKLRQQRQGGKPIEPAQIYDKVKVLQEAELKDIGRRNAQIRRSHEMEKKGLIVNYTLFEEEAELMRHLKFSKEERFPRLREELRRLCEKHLDRPMQLASDFVLGRVYKHCLILLDLESLIGNQEIENEFYHFKEQFDTRARKPETRDSFFSIVRQIHTLKDQVMNSEQKPDFFESSGFTYNDSTFDDLFVKKFQDLLNVSTESSDDEEEQPEAKDDQDDEEGQIISSSKQDGGQIMSQNTSGKESMFDLENSNQNFQEDEEEEPELDLNSVEPHKFNWFKYLIDKHLKRQDDEGNVTALLVADKELFYINLLNIVLGPKPNEEIQEELLDLVGFHNFTLLEHLMEKRDAIQIYCSALTEHLLEEKKAGQGQYRGKNMNMAPVSIGVTVQKVSGNKKGKKGKNKDPIDDRKGISNYDLLKSLGFDDSLIEENKKLGLKEKWAMRQPFIDPNQRTAKDAQVFEKKPLGGHYTVKEEDNHEYKFVEITPPPKKEMPQGDQVLITQLPKFAQPAFGYTKALNQIQSIVYPVAFKESRNMIVAAPTGAGKTNVALLTILRQVSEHVDQDSEGPWDLSAKQFQIVYIAPLKALAAEIVAKFESALGYLKLKVRELTGDMSISKAEIGETHIIVATPEKWDVVTRKTDGMMDRVNCLIIDEIHLLNDPRGLVLECLVSRALITGLKNQKPIRLVGLSATLPNYSDVAEFIGADEKGTIYFDSSYRPTPLKCGFYGIKEMSNVKRANNVMNDIIYTNLKRMLRMGKQAIIFAHKRGETYSTALELIDILKERSGDAMLFECMDSWKVKKEVDKSTNQQIKDLFKFGFGIHHAGMLRKDRNLTEKLFAEGHIKVLCSTATLAWGVNLPAYGVLIKGTKVYDSNAGGYKDVGIFDVQQIFGRAGRPQFDVEGEGIILTQHKQMDEYVKMMSNKQAVESHLSEGLENCINAEIAAGTITTVTEGVQWLKKSFFFQRVKKNPVAYGVKYDELQMDPTGHMILLEKVTKSIELLNRRQLIRYNIQTEGVFATDMGRIACNYYVDCATMSYFMANLNSFTNQSQFLYHLAQASEFKQLEARKEEHEELKYLCQDIIFVEVDKACFNEAHTKVLVLLECYLRKKTVKTFSLISDMAYVAQNVARLIRAMFEIALQKNFANLAKIALNWCKIIDKRLKPDDHPMKQFTLDSSYGKLTNASEKVTKYGYLKDEIVYRLKQFDISLDQIYDKELAEAKRYLPPVFQDELYKFASYIPYFDIEVTCQPITRAILKVQVNLYADFEWSDRWNGKNEPFWVMVDNETEILHSEFFVLHKKDVKKKFSSMKNEEGVSLTFFIPYEVKEGETRIGAGQYYNLTLLSDRWFDISYYKNINLSELEVPDADFPNTRLLPLRPISIKALGNEKFEALYENKFKFFNPVQTQVFHTLYHTDSNVLIGAPTGSGKTIMSELGMLRVFKNTPESKIIFIAPLKALAKERIIDWKRRLEDGPMKKSVLELTGDVTPDLKALQKANVLITTPEKWDGISRNWQHRSYVSSVALVIIDEIHLLGQERGPVIEVIISRMRYISEQTGNNVRFVGLSTALANAKDVADWMGIHKLGLYNFKPSVRPVPIKVFFEGFSEKHYCPRMGTMNRPAYKAIMTHSRQHPVLIFVSSRRQTRLTALDLIAMCAADQQETAANTGNFEFNKPFLHMDPEEIHQISEFIKDENLRHTIQFGVGMHHAGLTESDRKIVEELFVKKKIQVLVTTSTLAWGVNFPARLVIVKGTEFYDAGLKRYVDFPLTDLLQMIGRAGRPQFDDCGIACVFVAEEKKNFYKKFLYEPFPVESSLAGQITDHINAEIASGTLTKFDHCIDYLTWTYFFRRLTKNPAYYGLKNDVNTNNIALSINNYLRQLVQQTIDKLLKAGCIEYTKEDQSLCPTPLGFLASFYYLSHETIAYLGSKISGSSSIEDLLGILSNAKEFAGLPVRHNEDVLNEALTHLVPFKVAKHDLESPHVKSNLLLQAHFERCPLPITDYITDTKSVLDQSIRIIQGMIDISSHKGYLSTTINLVHMIQMIIQGQWLDQSPLINIPQFEDGEIIRKLAHLGILYLPQLIDRCSGDIKHFFSRTLGHSLPFEDLKTIFRALEKVPIVEMKYSIVKTNSQEELLSGELLQEGGDAMVVINLRRTNKSNKQFVSICNFPKPKECSWFILVGNPEKNELLAMKRVAFKRYANKNISISLPRDFYDDRLEIYLLCDSYIGLDQSYTIDLLQVNGAIKGQLDDYEADANDTVIDPEAEIGDQPQNIRTNQEEEAQHQSIFFNGFAAFDQLQRDIVDDILSDDGDLRKASKQDAPKVQEEEEEDDQINSMSTSKPSKMLNQIEANINLFLDSDEDEEQERALRFGQEDGMIEKDLDNWI